MLVLVLVIDLLALHSQGQFPVSITITSTASLSTSTTKVQFCEIRYTFFVAVRCGSNESGEISGVLRGLKPATTNDENCARWARALESRELSMQAKNLPVAKITRPTVDNILLRPRLFQQLDDAGRNPVIWVSGPPGCGKTMLIASYLDSKKIPSLWYQIDERDGDPATFFYYLGMAAKAASPRVRKPLPLLTREYAAGISIFILRYFESLFARLTTPCMLVLDNYQDIAPDAQFHEIIRDGLSVVPEGVNVVLISRESPPPQLARLQANGKISFLGWNDIRFTVDESKEMVRIKGHGNIDDQILSRLGEKVEGWAAGLVLMMEASKTKELDPQMFDEFTSQRVCEYFAGEIFRKRDKATREFLVKTAFLPRMTADMARELTGEEKAGEILANLSRNNYFIETHFRANPVYQYHSLYRDYMIERAQEILGTGELEQLRGSAAAILERAGQIEDAIRLFLQLRDWESAIRLILRAAPELRAQGRCAVFEGWLCKAPKDVVGQSPWLLYWMGVCRLPHSPDESRVLLEKAFKTFGEQGNTAGVLVSWADIVNAVINEWDDFRMLDPWIDWLDNWTGNGGSFPSPEIEGRVACSMAGALVYRRPNHPDIEKWVEHAFGLMRQVSDINLRLQICMYASAYHIWMGDQVRTGLVLEEVRKMVNVPDASPVMRIAHKNLEALFHIWSKASCGPALQFIAEGLDTARITGIHLKDHTFFGLGVYASLTQGDVTSAREYLKRMKSTITGTRRHILCRYHFFSFWYSLVCGDFAQANMHGEAALKLVTETGMFFPETVMHITMAQALCERKEFKEANAQLLIAQERVHASGSKLLRYMYLLGQAQLTLDQGEEEAGLKYLKEAMALGRRQGYVNMLWWWWPDTMARLCARALQEGIETEYVQGLIRKRGLLPKNLPLEVEEWPWPLKIYTLGRFELIREGVPLQYAGRVQQKPLTLLKALIAYGGKDVAEVHLCNVLWPDADGDAAHSAFTTTLGRLRHLLGTKEAIVFREGKASLHPQCCWVDLWHFERLASRADGRWTAGTRQEGLKLTEEALRVYRGHFLPGEEEQFWTISCRERLRTRFLRLANNHGEYFEQTGRFEKAVGAYSKALEVDNVAEELYQRLMICHYRLGRHAEAARVYKYCREVLSAVLGIEPSPRTVDIYASRGELEAQR